MIRAPQLERRRRQDDTCVTRRWSVATAGQACGRIEFDAFQRGVTVTDMLREMPQHASLNDGAAAS
jgi:hypothetical protein